MPTEPETFRLSSPADEEKLVEALKKIELLVQEHAGNAAASGNALGLLRVLYNISAEDWERIAKEHRLSNWLYFPVRSDSAESARQLLTMQKRLVHESDHDSLTGICNRRFLKHTLEIEVDRAARAQTELSLLYIDIDNFKQVNDSYGHDCGDMVLIRLAQLLKNSIRHYDLAVRLGGDEFVVLLPTSSCWTGVMMGERLLEAFSAIVFDCQGQTFSLTFSAGVSSLALCSEETAEALIKNADTAMYEAKRKGKSNIVLARSCRKVKDYASLVHAQEKLLLFSGPDSE